MDPTVAAGVAHVAGHPVIVHVLPNADVTQPTAASEVGLGCGVIARH
jgi:hypothetical protein